MDIIKFLLPKTFCAEFQLKKKTLLNHVHIYFYGGMCT